MFFESALVAKNSGSAYYVTRTLSLSEQGFARYPLMLNT